MSEMGSTWSSLAAGRTTSTSLASKNAHGPLVICSANRSGKWKGKVFRLWVILHVGLALVAEAHSHPGYDSMSTTIIPCTLLYNSEGVAEAALSLSYCHSFFAQGHCVVSVFYSSQNSQKQVYGI